MGSHTSEFNNPQVISVCENKIHVAIGYGLANVIVLEGTVTLVVKNSGEAHLELVSKELNHLAAILQVYAGGLNFMK